MSFPLYVDDFARPASQWDEFANCDLCAVMFANAPAAMYFVISVLPNSMTSGVLPPAIVASKFWRWLPHVWYCTSTFQPGLAFSNCLLRCRDDIRPAALCVDLEPHGECVRGLCARACGRRDYDAECERGDDHRGNTESHTNLPRAGDARAERVRHLWPEDVQRPAVRRMVYTN